MKLSQLREARNAKAKAAHDLNAKYPADKRMPVEDASTLDALLAEVEAIDADIAREQRVLQMEAAQNPQAAEERARHAATKTPGAHGDESRPLRAFLTGGLSALSQNDLQALRERQNGDIRAAMSTTTNSEGGYTTSPEYQRTLEAAMKAYGGVRAVADTFRTATGTQMLMPTANATSEVGEIVAQNAAVSGADTTFGQLAMDVYKFSSKKIALPFELIQDSYIDIEAYIREVLAVRLGRVTATYFATGSGSSQPHGLVTGATLGVTGGTGQETSVTHDDLVDLQHAIDPAYRGAPGVGYMMHDASVAKIRKIKDSEGRPIFVPGYEQGNPGGAPDMLLGRPVYVCQEMAVMAADAKSILFGDFKKYRIRQVMDLTLFRMTDSAFTLNGQVGFVAFMREGGRLMDVGGAVKYYMNTPS